MRPGALLLVWAASAAPPAGQTFTTLHSFNGVDGEYPTTALVQGVDGNVYGATLWGGTNAAYPYGGTTFQITTSGTLTTLYDFCEGSSDCPHGAAPILLVPAPDGNFFGATQNGGFTDCNTADGCGTIFTLSPSGALQTLYKFCPPSVSDCGSPPNALIQAANGDLYGTTLWGGANCLGCGTVFRIDASGALTTLYNFCSQISPNGICADGEQPDGLIQAANGDFYGVTQYGGSNVGPYGYGGGTVFKITPAGAYTVLHNFCARDYEGNCTDGSEPVGSLIQAPNGFLYGTTLGGGSHPGTVFRITLDGQLTTVYRFCAQSGCADGWQPFSGLLPGSDGNLYGTTYNGGNSSSAGTIFKISKGGTLTTLYSFCSQPNCTDGQGPVGKLVQATNGTIYGTTVGGGANDICNDLQGGSCGTVFSLDVGLGPFVKTEPGFGKVGTPVTILGTDLTGTTSVSFDGVAAAFTIVSPTKITTTVPSGAASGTVSVVTTGGTLLSSLPFRIT